MTQRGKSIIPVSVKAPDGEVTIPPETVEELAQELIEHQAGIQIDYLYDHGWQVYVSSPGGSTYVHACDYPNKWPKDGGPGLGYTIAKAIAKAKQEGWW